MNIIFKFLWNNIKEKKMRTCLILFAIAIATALCFASWGVADSFKAMVVDKYKAQFGNGDIVITKKENSISPFLEKEKVEQIKGKYKGEILNLSSAYKQKGEFYNVNISATNLTEISNINKITYKENSLSKGLNEIKDNEVIIASKVASNLQLKVGDDIEIKINGDEKVFKVGAVALDKGFFEEKPGIMTLMGDLQGITKTLNMDDKINTILLEKENSESTEKLKQELSNKYDDFKVMETMDKAALEEAINQFMIPFYVMLSVVVIMAIFIIYSSFKVIVLERMSVIGTFRSIGANKLTTDAILLIESLIYGVIGGLIGNAIGIPLLYMITDSANPYKQQGIKTIISINPKYMIMALLIGIMLSFFSALIPIIKIGKIEIKDIILSSFKSTERNKFAELLLGIILIILPYIYYEIYKYSAELIYTIICPFMVLAGIALLIPYLIKILNFLLKELIRSILGNEGTLALHNMATTKNLIQNVSILTLGLGAVIIVHTSSYSVREMVINTFKGLDYKVSISDINRRNGEMVLDKIKKQDNVDEYYENYYSNEIKVKDKDYKLGYFQGVDREQYLDFYKDFRIYDENGDLDKKEQLQRLDEDRNIILSDLFKNKYKYKNGDIIAINLNDKFYEYRVIGFIESEISSNQRVCLISKNNFKEDMEQQYPNSVFVKGNFSEVNLKDIIKDELSEFNVIINTKSEEEKANISKNSDLMNTLQSFSTMALIIGAFGMVNNLMVSFLERKRELAVLASLGMSKLQRGKMILIEGVFSGIIGGVLGCISGMCLVIFIPEITLSLDTYLNMKVPMNQIIILGVLGAIIMIAASFVPLIKARDISIVEEIKYE